MLHRYSIKIGGQSGTGINSVGHILAKSFKTSHFYTFAYREYPSLIKGGFASYQIDLSNVPVNSVSNQADLYIAIDKWSFEHLIEEIGEGDIFIYDKNIIRVSPEQQKIIDENHAVIYPLEITMTAKKVGGNTIMKNAVILGALWSLLGLEKEIIIEEIVKTFNKSAEIAEANKKCTLAGMEMLQTNPELLARFNERPVLENQISISGNEAIAIGAVAAGVRAYFAYPMTPSSTILSTMSKFADKTKILVKQAEDEITAANMTIGANFAGTRAMTGTSGGGFDLMTETLSLAGITETPFVVALAQRPGPATGVPTWTLQGDLKIAVNAGHGEFTRVVLAPGNPEECFKLTAEAFNIAEKYQTVVIILTDKFLAESMYSTKAFDANSITIDRGDLILEGGNKEMLRYAYTDTGISQRWLPGNIDANTYIANSDEHDEYGHSVEGASDIKNMIDKRLKKESSIFAAIPEPEIFGESDAQISFIGWGSTKHIMLDSIEELKNLGIKVNYLHFSYVYPLKTETLNKFVNENKNVWVIENNEKGQFADMIEFGIKKNMDQRLLKYDGRPFFVEDVITKVNQILNQTNG